MVEQPTQEIKLTADQRRNLGHVYRIILGWRRDRKNITSSPSLSESIGEEIQTHPTKSESAEQAESGS